MQKALIFLAFCADSRHAAGSGEVMSGGGEPPDRADGWWEAALHGQAQDRAPGTDSCSHSKECCTGARYTRPEACILAFIAALNMGALPLMPSSMVRCHEWGFTYRNVQ